jgi:hypothetical protein
MAKMEYVPAPVPTEGVEIPAELMELTEVMAKNVHEVWAEARMAEGWTYGLQRNDVLKTHPGLVPYEELPESERAYDRNTAIGTLKLIRALGYDIVKSN